MTTPGIEIDPEVADSFRERFAELLEQQAETGIPLVTEQPRPKRKGRFPYLRNPDGSIQKDADGNPLKDTERAQAPSYKAPSVHSSGISASPLPAAPLSKREEKQVAERLEGILQGITGVVSVANDTFQMTDDEARAIAEPLSSYLIRMEPTSKVARQILDEYDLVAVATGSAAYGVRVYRDLKKERDTTRESRKALPLEPLAGRPTSQPNSTNDGRGTSGIEEPAGEIRKVKPSRAPIMPSDGVQLGFQRYGWFSGQKRTLIRTGSNAYDPRK